MLANKVFLNYLIKKHPLTNIAQLAAYSTGGFHDVRLPIGKREWVGFGRTSQPNYTDKIDYPMPGVRFKEITGELVALREKEKGDWKNLTIEEKKKLYRASFRQTLAEVEAPTGEWKSVLGWTMFFLSLGIWIYLLERMFIYQPLPETFSEEWRAATLRRMLDLKTGHLTGISSKWDYEKNDWKK